MKPLDKAPSTLFRDLLQIEEFLDLAHGVFGTLDRVTNGAGVAVDLPVVATLIGLIAKEVNGVVADAAGLLGLGLEVTKAVGLVPAGREDVEGNLTADREATIRVRTALANAKRNRLT
jgi:hypothetical protein